MREIKFRAWNKRINRMIYLEVEKFQRMSSLGWYEAPFEELLENHIPIMQYTGLKG